MQNLFRLANIMGLDADNTQHTALLKESMHNIVKPEEFIEYCRNQKDGIEYMNRVEKLDLLATRYKKTLNDIPTKALEKFCKNISNKFKTAIQTLRDHEEHLSENLSKLRDRDKQYFTDKEIELLNYTGKLNRLINLYELNTLYDALYNSSIKKTLIKRTSIKLTDNQKKVMKLARGIA